MRELDMINLDYGRYKIMEEKVSGQDFILGTVEYEDVLLKSAFHSCSFTFMRKKFLWLIDCEFYDCKFITKKLVETRINDNYYEGCSFFGEFRGANFGIATDVDGVPTRWPDIALKNCDFSKATMSGCGIKRLDRSNTIFPVWPCFSILHPHENLQRWLDAKLPFQSRFYQYSSSPGLSAEMYHWPSMVKWYEIDPVPDLEDVRTALSKLDFIRL